MQLLTWYADAGSFLGPIGVGFAGDHYPPVHPVHSLRLALYIVVPFYIIAIVPFLILAQALRRKEPI